jgi:hypothetical protein
MLTEDVSGIEERDLVLEETASIIFVSDNQVNKARNRLANNIQLRIPLGHHKNTRYSTDIFKQNDKSYKIFLEVEDLGPCSMTNRTKMQGFQSIFGKYAYLPFPHPSWRFW